MHILYCSIQPIVSQQTHHSHIHKTTLKLTNKATSDQVTLQRRWIKSINYPSQSTLTDRDVSITYRKTDVNTQHFTPLLVLKSNQHS